MRSVSAATGLALVGSVACCNAAFGVDGLTFGAAAGGNGPSGGGGASTGMSATASGGAGQGGGTGGGTSAPCDVAFTVVSSEPSTHALAADPTDPIEIHFSCPVGASLTPGAVDVRGAQSGLHATSVLPSDDATTLVLGHSRPFAVGERVTVVVTSAVRDGEGRQVPPHAWQFWTATQGGNGTFGMTQELAAACTETVALIDLDADGDLDAFEANRDGDSATHHNETGIFLSAQSDFAGTNGLTAAWGDLDDDGFPDLVMGGLSASVRLNAGDGTIATTGMNLTVDEVKAIALGDFDANGGLDIFISGSAGSRLWNNDGRGNFGPGLILAPANSFRAEAGDADGDGDLDIFVAVRGGANVLLRNDGDLVFSSETLPGVPTAESLGLATGDFDGDGDLDVFFGNFQDTADELLLNDGTGTFTVAATYGTGLNTVGVAAGDLDADGDLDLYVTHNESTNSADRVWLNDGDGSFTGVSQSPPLESRNTYAVALGDVDADGDLDAYVGNWSMSGGACEPNAIWKQGGAN